MQNWYKRAIIYEVLLLYYRDSNADGTGDFQGLTQALGHLSDLGVTCLWLSPFFDSPWRDNGYDVRGDYQVDERFGSKGDFVHFLAQAETHGLRVIIDMVLNHTSIDHPWFQSARKSKDSPYRDYYIWSDTYGRTKNWNRKETRTSSAWGGCGRSTKRPASSSTPISTRISPI